MRVKSKLSIVLIKKLKKTDLKLFILGINLIKKNNSNVHWVYKAYFFNNIY